MPVPRLTPARLTIASLVLLVVGCRTVTGPRATDPPSVFDEAWTLVDEHYAFFEEWGVDWPAARARYGGTLTAASTQAEVRQAICGLVDAMRSYHAGLTTPAGTCSYASAPRYPAGYDAALVERALVRPATTHSGRMRYARLDTAYGAAVGYLRIASFDGAGWGGDVDEALAGLAGVRALVIDVRANPGGNEEVAQVVASRFADQKRVYRVAWFRDGPSHRDFGAAQSPSVGPAGTRFVGPVAVLTDRGDHSAAEDFVMMMRVMPSVVVVGDTTFGTSSNPRTETLANGWTLRIPQSLQRTPEGLVVEGRGLPPHIAVRLAPNDVARGTDTIMAAAAAELRRRLQ